MLTIVGVLKMLYIANVLFMCTLKLKKLLIGQISTKVFVNNVIFARRIHVFILCIVVLEIIYTIYIKHVQ